MNWKEQKTFLMVGPTILGLLAATSSATAGAAQTHHAVTELIDSVEANLPYKDEARRIRAYRKLADAHAAATDRGFHLLADGLSDPAVSDICAAALLRASPDRQAEVVQRVGRFLRTEPEPPMIKEGPGVHGVLRAIGELGTMGAAHLDAVDYVLHDSNRKLETRVAAARAILQIEPLVRALDHAHDLDPCGQEAFLQAWPAQVAKAISKMEQQGESFDDAHPVIMGKLRTLVVEGLKSPRAETRRAAYGAMAVAYHGDLVIIRSRDDYEVNPELRPILQDMGANDPDPVLRDWAETLLDPATLDLRVRNTLIRREREAKKKR